MSITQFEDFDKGMCIAVASGSGTPAAPAVQQLTMQSVATFIQPFDSGICLGGTGSGTPDDPFVQAVSVGGGTITTSTITDPAAQTAINALAALLGVTTN